MPNWYNRKTWLAGRCVLSVVMICSCMASSQAGNSGAQFVAESDAAMSRMMAAMHVEPSGEVDCDFVAMMAPHHQGAIDMARSQLRYGTNERLRRLAQEIIVTQQQEIVVMRAALTESSHACPHAVAGAH